ncbi:MAG: STAS-like domain-containing protein [Muribaculaceae bacterium]|nr:STAS-like domain-containing protein [Muribaculaceae bacterium]
MNTIRVTSVIGPDIRTRLFFRKHIDDIMSRNNPYVIFDFSGVEFISRSVADEIFNIQLDYNRIKIMGLEGDVKKMYEVVRQGRISPRRYPDSNITTIRLHNMEELNNYFGNATW